MYVCLYMRERHERGGGGRGERERERWREGERERGRERGSAFQVEGDLLPSTSVVCEIVGKAGSAGSGQSCFLLGSHYSAMIVVEKPEVMFKESFKTELCDHGTQFVSFRKTVIPLEAWCFFLGHIGFIVISVRKWMLCIPLLSFLLHVQISVSGYVWWTLTHIWNPSMWKSRKCRFQLSVLCNIERRLKIYKC